MICTGVVIAFCFQYFTTQLLPFAGKGRIHAFSPFRARQQGDGAGESFVPGEACDFTGLVFRCKAKLVQGRFVQGSVFYLVKRQYRCGQLWLAGQCLHGFLAQWSDDELCAISDRLVVGGNRIFRCLTAVIHLQLWFAAGCRGVVVSSKYTVTDRLCSIRKLAVEG